MNHPTRHSVWAALAVLPALALLPGCGPNNRAEIFRTGSAPSATIKLATVRITAIERSLDEVTLTLNISNPTSQPINFARHYGAFTSAILEGVDIRIIGERSPKRPRTTPLDRYTVSAGEDALLSLAFKAPGVDRAVDLVLHLTGSTNGFDQSWNINIPPESTRPTAMVGHH
jgi:hypothetical protein